MTVSLPSVAESVRETVETVGTTGTTGTVKLSLRRRVQLVKGDKVENRVLVRPRVCVFEYVQERVGFRLKVRVGGGGVKGQA